MKLTFLGAAHEVTGSRFLLEACGKNIMIDYGMEQGKNLFENAELPVAPGELDFALERMEELLARSNQSAHKTRVKDGKQ